MRRPNLGILLVMSLAVSACSSGASNQSTTSPTSPNPGPVATTTGHIGPIAELPQEERIAATFTLFSQGLPAADLIDQLGIALEAEISDPLPGDGPGWFSASETLQEQYTRVMAAEGESAIPAIRQRMASTDGTAGLWYLVALGYAGDDTIDSDLASAVASDPTPPVAMHLMKLVSERGIVEAVPMLKEYLTSDLQWQNTHVGGRPPIFPLRDQAAGALRSFGYTVYSDPDRPGVYEVIEP